MKKVKVGILGCGNVGKYLIKNLFELRELIKEKEKLDLEVTKVLVRDGKKSRTVDGFKIPQQLLTTSFSEVMNTSPDIVVELIGDVEVSRTFIKRCLEEGKKVVTANKFLLTIDDEIFTNENVFFDASVGGGIPIIRTIEKAVPDEITEITGILNGTTNFILSSMEDGMEFSRALELAQKMGYAEPEPSFDISGLDASQKICLLATIVFGIRVKPENIIREGISSIEMIDVEFAKEFGYSIKSIATIKKKKKSNAEEKFEIAVYPVLISRDSHLAQTKGNLNAVTIKGRRIGELFLKGEGAGGNPTSISIIADIIEASKGSKRDKRRIFPPDGKLINPEDIYSKFYVRIEVVDKPGVLAKIADSFGKNMVSIESVLQKGRGVGEEKGVPIFIITHETKESNLKKALEICSKLDVVLGAPFFLRIYQE